MVGLPHLCGWLSIRLGAGTPSLFFAYVRTEGVATEKSEGYKTKEQAGRKRNLKNRGEGK